MDNDVKVIDVLLVEDDPGDVLMTQEAFEEHKVRNRLTVVSDGAEALSYLRREGKYADAVREIAERNGCEHVLIDTSQSLSEQLIDYLKVAGQPVQGPWPPHQDPRPDPTEIESSPAVWDGTVYVGGETGRIVP